MDSSLFRRCEQLTWAQVCLAIRDGQVYAQQADADHYVVTLRELIDYVERERSGQRYPSIHLN